MNVKSVNSMDYSFLVVNINFFLGEECENEADADATVRKRAVSNIIKANLNNNTIQVEWPELVKVW